VRWGLIGLSRPNSFSSEKKGKEWEEVERHGVAVFAHHTAVHALMTASHPLD
jgi:hypothetical protein